MITNKTLLALILATLTVFILSFVYTTSSLQRSDRPYNPSTAHATSDRGNVTINVYDEVSITTDDDAIINFTDCTAGYAIYSDVANGNPQNSCEGFATDHIVVRNDGTVPANLTFNISDWGEAHGGTFLNSSTDDSWIAFKAFNDSAHPMYNGGCVGTLQTAWTNITDGSLLPVCDDLQEALFDNSISFDIAFYPPPTTQQGGEELVLVFYASLSMP